MNKVFVALLGVVLFFTSCSSDDGNHNYIGMDYRIFNDTPAEELARAVNKQNIGKIRQLVLEQGVDVNYQEPRYGNTVLMNAIMNWDNKSVRTLLDLGADPNLYTDTINGPGENSILIACQWNTRSSVLELLLKYGADPNSCTKGYQTNGRTKWAWRKTALDYASSFNFMEKVRLLVENGADVNHTPDGCQVPSALTDAIIQGNLEITLFLLEHGANYEGRLVCQGGYDNGETWDILYGLRLCTPPLWSKEYRCKKKIIDFLQERGLDYYQSPIPELAVQTIKWEYPLFWKLYMKFY